LGFVKTVARAQLETKATSDSFSVSDTEWYKREGYRKLAAFGGYGNYTGKTVNEETALDIPAFYAGVKIISEDMGNMPFFTYRKGHDGNSTDKAKDHRLWSVLHNLVNPEVSSGEFVEALTAHSIIAGSGMAQIQTFGRNRVYLWPWMPSEVTSDITKTGERVFIHKRANEAEKTYTEKQVFHLRGFTFDCATGDRLIKRARQALGMALAEQEFSARVFAADIHGGLYFSHPAHLGAEGVEHVLEGWRKKQGLAKAHEPKVLQDAMKAFRADPDMEKLQMIESRKFSILETCRILRLSPYKLADYDRATFSNVEHLDREHAKHALGSHIRRWKEAVHRCLLTREEQRDDLIYAEHSVEALVRGDFKTQTEGFRAMLEKGVYSINEVRKWLNMNPVPGGDKHYVQMNMQEITETAKVLATELLAELKERAQLRSREEEAVALLEESISTPA
jgi:HK97 family phage portal protein